MADRGNGRIVYSTGAGRICPDCGEPERACRCDKSAADERMPNRMIAKLRVEKKGRGGKLVTVIDGLPQNAIFLKDLSRELKQTCGTGGTVLDHAVELQGDLRERARAFLTKKGFAVKG